MDWWIQIKVLESFLLKVFQIIIILLHKKVIIIIYLIQFQRWLKLKIKLQFLPLYLQIILNLKNLQILYLIPSYTMLNLYVVLLEEMKDRYDQATMIPILAFITNKIIQLH